MFFVPRSARTALLLCISLIFVVAGPEALRAEFSLPVESPLYDDLEHFRALGSWRGSLASRPLSRAELKRAVRSIEEGAAIRPLDAGDVRRLSRLRLAVERGNVPVSATPTAARLGTPPVLWEAGAAIRFYGAATGLDSLADLDRRGRREGAFFVSLRAALGSHVRIESRFYEDYSRLTSRPDPHWVDNLPPDLRGTFTDPSARNDRAVLACVWGWGDARLGREDRHLGVGRRGTLFLSETPFPLDGISFRMRTRYVSGTSLFAQTLREPNRAGFRDSLPAPGDAYLTAHRIEIHPPGPVRLGLYEAVVFGGRDIDLAYVNPVGFLVAVTQDLFDRAGVDDKKILGADLVWTTAPITLYGEFLLNRLVTLDAATAGPESEISSYGELAGLHWANPFHVGGADLHLEYAHLDPEVYFHRDRDPRRAFLSQGELIGHWAGPNADVLYAAWAAPPTARHGAFRVEIEQVRWGLRNGLRGTEAGFTGLRRKEKQWITGDVQRERTVAAGWNASGLPGPGAGQFDLDLEVARVVRSGPWPEGQRSGWQAELRLGYEYLLRWFDPGSD